MNFPNDCTKILENDFAPNSETKWFRVVENYMKMTFMMQIIYFKSASFKKKQD